MGRCGECRWWDDYGVRHSDSFNGACTYYEAHSMTAKGFVEECDVDFGCVQWQPK
jgi:uncharacterized protein YodC (DUF2158 family)